MDRWLFQNKKPKTNLFLYSIIQKFISSELSETTERKVYTPDPCYIKTNFVLTTENVMFMKPMKHYFLVHPILKYFQIPFDLQLCAKLFNPGMNCDLKFSPSHQQIIWISVFSMQHSYQIILVETKHAWKSPEITKLATSLAVMAKFHLAETKSSSEFVNSNSIILTASYDDWGAACTVNPRISPQPRNTNF